MKKTGKTISKCAVVVAVVLMYTLYATTAKIDDWQYGPQPPPPEKSPTFALALNPSSGTPSTKLGLAAGGAKGIENFRENIENNYLPLSTDMMYEGLFYCYYFDTGEKEDCNQLFCPSYSYAITQDPFSHKKEYYLTVGLNSGIRARDFKRKNLNLVIVLDISDSMNGFFDKYYYDEGGNRMESDEGENPR